jgi:type II secretory pathway pseudopilin PulG
MTDLESVAATADGSPGFSLVGIVLALLVVAVAGTAVYTYLGATRQSLETINVERPMNQARLAADLQTLAQIRTQLGVYHAGHGTWPPSRDAVAALLSPAPRFQCAGQDYIYDPGSGAVGLVVMDARRC